MISETQTKEAPAASTALAKDTGWAQVDDGTDAWHFFHLGESACKDFEVAPEEAHQLVARQAENGLVCVVCQKASWKKAIERQQLEELPPVPDPLSVQMLLHTAFGRKDLVQHLNRQINASAHDQQAKAKYTACMYLVQTYTPTRHAHSG
jgi:hypothetical protein